MVPLRIWVSILWPYIAHVLPTTHHTSIIWQPFRQSGPKAQSNDCHSCHQPICKISPHDMLFDPQRKSWVHSRWAYRTYNGHYHLCKTRYCSNRSTIGGSRIDVHERGAWGWKKHDHRFRTTLEDGLPKERCAHENKNIWTPRRSQTRLLNPCSWPTRLVKGQSAATGKNSDAVMRKRGFPPSRLCSGGKKASWKTLENNPIAARRVPMWEGSSPSPPIFRGVARYTGNMVRKEVVIIVNDA